MKLVKTLGIFVGLLVASTGSKCAPPKEPATSGPPQHFVCNTGYAVEKCHKDVAVLRKVLEKYPVAQLGEWTWVLVLSSDWKSIRVPRGLDRNSPAFTYYAARETFHQRKSHARQALCRRRPRLLEVVDQDDVAINACIDENLLSYSSRLLRAMGL